MKSFIKDVFIDIFCFFGTSFVFKITIWLLIGFFSTLYVYNKSNENVCIHDVPAIMLTTMLGPLLPTAAVMVKIKNTYGDVVLINNKEGIK